MPANCGRCSLMHCPDRQQATLQWSLVIFTSGWHSWSIMNSKTMCAKLAQTKLRQAFFPTSDTLLRLSAVAQCRLRHPQLNNESNQLLARWFASSYCKCPIPFAWELIYIVDFPNLIKWSPTILVSSREILLYMNIKKNEQWLDLWHEPVTGWVRMGNNKTHHKFRKFYARRGK